MQKPCLIFLVQQKLPTLLLLLSNSNDPCLSSLSDDYVTMTSSNQSVVLHVKYSTTTEHNPSEANYCCGRGNSKPKNGCHNSNKHYKKKLVRVLLDRGPNRDLVFVTKDKPMLFPYSKSWFHSCGILQMRSSKLSIKLRRS